MMLIPSERHDPQQQEDFREQAHELLQTVLDKNNEADERRVSQAYLENTHGLTSVQISVIVEFVAGKVTEMLMKMIALYRPDCEYLCTLADDG